MFSAAVNLNETLYHSDERSILSDIFVTTPCLSVDSSPTPQHYGITTCVHLNTKIKTLFSHRYVLTSCLTMNTAVCVVFKFNFMAADGGGLGGFAPEPAPPSHAIAFSFSFVSCPVSLPLVFFLFFLCFLFSYPFLPFFLVLLFSLVFFPVFSYYLSRGHLASCPADILRCIIHVCILLVCQKTPPLSCSSFSNVKVPARFSSRTQPFLL